jgi:hypothetical protein
VGPGKTLLDLSEDRITSSFVNDLPNKSLLEFEFFSSTLFELPRQDEKATLFLGIFLIFGDSESCGSSRNIGDRQDELTEMLSLNEDLMALEVLLADSYKVLSDATLSS